MLVGFTILFVLTSIQYLSRSIEDGKRAELSMHADRVASSLKAQIFERYADSQAFAINSNLILALTHPSPENARLAVQTLNHLIALYKVYEASVLTDVDGNVIAASSKSPLGAPLPPNRWRGHAGVTAQFWQGSDPAPQTQVRDLEFWPDLQKYFGTVPVQMFSSPIYDKSGKLIGVVSNYHTGLYIEREMNIALEDLARLGISIERIQLSNESRRVIGVFAPGGFQYLPASAKQPAPPAAGELSATREMRDERIQNSPKWSIDLVVDRRSFLEAVTRLRAVSYLVAGSLLIAIFYSVFMLQRYRLRSERETLIQIQTSQEAERARLAREVHDELGQTLSAIKIQMKRALNQSGDERAGTLEDVQLMIEEAIDSVRRISHDLHPSLIENLGLEAALRWKLDQARKIGGIETEVEISPPGSLDSLPNASKTQLYRIFQEAMTNIQKHSKASRVSLQISKSGRRLGMQIEDDGVGFDPLAMRRSLGLKSIQERAALMGGRATIESNAGRGTCVSCYLELKSGEGGVDEKKAANHPC